MSTPVSARGQITDISFAPHPLNEGVTPRAARIAEGARRASSAQLRETATEVAWALVQACSLALFFAAVIAWAPEFIHR